MRAIPLLRLDALRQDADFIENLRLDLTPEALFVPRFGARSEETNGYMFYIDLMNGPPALMLMKTFRSTSKTLGEVEGCPAEVLEAATKREGIREISGMYPISQEITDWIRDGLGLSP